MEEVTSENRFQCQLCLKTFKRKDHLANHERTHTEERPFQCEICNKAFARKDNLDKHRRIHEKHFECDKDSEFDFASFFLDNLTQSRAWAITNFGELMGFILLALETGLLFSSIGLFYEFMKEINALKVM